MIYEDGSILPDLEELEDKQFTEEASKNDWQKCGTCNYYGNSNDMQYHKSGMRH